MASRRARRRGCRGW
uniref:Uncharacterized protein n=1 Tax=Arundo donax TaxID=35708 RepID=A0A0A9HVK4_ARUDO